MSKILNHKLILGTVQMGLPYGINNTVGKVSLEDSQGILEYAFNNGINILDTAEAYGNAHQVIGKFHENNPKKTFEVITKLPHKLNTSFSDKVDEYLNVLKVNQLHALLFHSFLSYKENRHNFELLTQLKLRSKIKHIGVSVYTNEEVKEVIEDDQIDIIQLPFNLFDNLNLRGNLLKKAKAKGKLIHTRSAFLQGLFFKDVQSPNPAVQSLKKDLIVLSNIIKNHNISKVELALNYCLQQPNIDNVLIGVESLQQLSANLKAIKSKLNHQIMADVNTIKIKDIDFLNPSLWN